MSDRIVARLTEQSRERIRKRLIGDRFDAEEKMVADDIAKFAEKVYWASFTESQLASMNSLPHGWLPRVKTLKGRFNGSDVQLPLREGLDLPVPHDKYSCHGNSNFLVNCTSDSPLCQEWFKIRERQSSLQNARETLKDKIRAVLHSVTTTAKLIKTWPEIKNVVEEICWVSDVANLPAPIMVELNAALGL